MSFNRLIYDTCAYKKNLKESLDVGVYQLYAGKYDNKNKCRVDFGIVGGNDVSLYKGNLVDLESELKGQTRPMSLCPKNKYMPVCKQPNTEGLPSGPNNCNSEFIDLPICQMVCHKPVVYAELPKGSYCTPSYRVENKEELSTSINEGFCDGCSDIY